MRDACDFTEQVQGTKRAQTCLKGVTNEPRRKRPADTRPMIIIRRFSYRQTLNNRLLCLFVVRRLSNVFRASIHSRNSLRKAEWLKSLTSNTVFTLEQLDRFQLDVLTMRFFSLFKFTFRPTDNPESRTSVKRKCVTARYQHQSLHTLLPIKANLIALISATNTRLS